MFRKQTRALTLTLVSVCASAKAQDDFLQPSDPGHGGGTLWFQSIGASSSGGAKLTAHRMFGVDAGGFAGVHSAILKWNNSKILYVTSQGTSGASRDVEITPGVPLALCRGVATFNGGFVVTDPAGGPVSAVRPHAGALVWNDTNLYALEAIDSAAVPGSVGVQALLPGTFRGVAVLGSKIDDISAVSGVVNSHVVASALAYRDDKVFRIELDMAGGAMSASVNELLDPVGAPITNLLGVTLLNTGFRTSATPDAPEAAAVLWNSSHVWYYEHRTTGDSIVEMLHPTSLAPLAGCWGVMPIYFNEQPGPLQPTTSGVADKHAYDIFTEFENFIAQGGTALEIFDQQNNFPTGVVIPANPLFKRQASGLYELQAKSSGDGTRGMIIGLNQ